MRYVIDLVLFLHLSEAGGIRSFQEWESNFYDSSNGFDNVHLIICTINSDCFSLIKAHFQLLINVQDVRTNEYPVNNLSQQFKISYCDNRRTRLQQITYLQQILIFNIVVSS